jgi:hypothetical protein
MFPSGFDRAVGSALIFKKFLEAVKPWKRVLLNDKPGKKELVLKRLANVPTLWSKYRDLFLQLRPQKKSAQAPTARRHQNQQNRCNGDRSSRKQCV